MGVTRNDLARGPSPEQTARARVGELHISGPTVYRRTEAGYGGMTNLEPRRKVGHRPRPETGGGKTTSHGESRSHKAFLASSEEARAQAREMDTVVGRPADSQCLLTPYRRGCSVQPPPLTAEKTKAATIARLDEVERALGAEGFHRLFGLIITDNGTEFADHDGIERSIFGGRRRQVFYCDPMQSQQKPGCGRNHVEIRRTLPKGRGTPSDDLGEVDSWFVGSRINPEPRPKPMGLSPLRMPKAADPELTDAIAGRLGFVELPYDELDLTLDGIDRERVAGGLKPSA